MLSSSIHYFAICIRVGDQACSVYAAAGFILLVAFDMHEVEIFTGVG